mgnify:CR=1 FL=1
MPPELHWLRPGWLWLLPALALVLAWLLRRARQVRRWEALVDAPLRPFVLSGAGGARPEPLLAGLACLWLLAALALAGPSWQLADKPVFRIAQPRVLLLDLSQSMQAVDVTSSRLARARFEIMDLLRGADEGQFALIAFGAEPFLVAPLTTDVRTIVEQVPLLEPDVLPLGGERRTDLALEFAGRLLQRSGAPGADVVLITDGLAPAEATRAAARALASAGHRVSVLALAQRAGLEPVADAGAGILVASRADDRDTERLLALHGASDPAIGNKQVSLDKQWRDDGPWLLLLALPLAALAFRRGWLAAVPVALLLLPPAPATAGIWDDLWQRPEQRALRAADAGRLEAALAGVDDPRWRAALHYRAGDYAGSLDALSGQQGAAAHYNRGNVLARLGRLEDAIAEYDAALALAPEHADARYNRELLRRLMGDPQDVRAAAEPGGDDQRANGDASEDADRDGAGAGGEAGVADPASPRSAAGEGGSSAPEDAAGDATAASAAGQPQGLGGGGGADGAERERQLGGTAPAAGATAADDAEPAAPPRGAAGVEPPDASTRGRPAAQAAEAARALSGADGDPDEAQAGAVADAYLLQQVPDDPGRLLRERLMLQYLRRHGQLH